MRAAARRAIDRRAELARHAGLFRPCGHVVCSPAAISSPPPRSTNCFSAPLAAAGGNGDVVQDDDRALLEVARRHAHDRHHVGLEHRRGADAERFRQVEATSRAIAACPTTSTDTGALGEARSGTCCRPAAGRCRRGRCP